MRRVRSLLVVAALAAAALPPAPAVALGCGGYVEREDKVTVVVDPGPLGGPVTWSCVDADDASTAAASTHVAGHALAYVQGTSFVCRVDGRPGTDEESCARTPPADAYWGLFWTEDREGEWVYSTRGVTALTVPGGGAIGWRWQDGGARDKPPALSAEPPPTPNPGELHIISEEPVEEEPTGGSAPFWAVGGVVLLLAAAVGTVARRRRADR